MNRSFIAAKAAKPHTEKFNGFLTAQRSRELSERGWTLTEADATDEQAFSEHLRKLAALFGVPVTTHKGDETISVLRPTEADEARPNSLSASYSTGSFPLHVDTAHWIVPCRYILLGCVHPGEGNRRTLLLDAAGLPHSEEERQLLSSTPLRVVNGRRSFFSTIWKQGRSFVRYDPGCMRAATADGARALAAFAAGSWPDHVAEVSWRKGNVLIIDNWRVLHGRSHSNVLDPHRTLMRVYVKGWNE